MPEQLQALHSEHIPQCTALTTSKHNSDKTVSDNPCGSLNGVPGDDDFGDGGTGNGDPNGGAPVGNHNVDWLLPSTALQFSQL
jgi:hypothetical protein